MKRIFIGGLITVLMVIGSFSVVGGQTEPISPPTEVRTTPGRLTNMIDDIDVPWEILEFVQMKYEGMAVTKAEKIKRNGTEIYRLRVDRDDIPTDYESLAVLFDMQWKFLGDEKYASPPPKPAPKPPEPVQETPPTTETNQIVGGNGGGNNEQEEKPDDPPEAPTPEPPQEDSAGTGSNGSGD
jgi:hypothetical protein